MWGVDQKPDYNLKWPNPIPCTCPLATLEDQYTTLSIICTYIWKACSVSLRQYFTWRPCKLTWWPCKLMWWPSKLTGDCVSLRGDHMQFRVLLQMACHMVQRDGISSHRLKWSRHNCIILIVCHTLLVHEQTEFLWNNSTPARLQIEKNSIRQVIVDNKELQLMWLGMKALPLKWTRNQ